MGPGTFKRALGEFSVGSYQSDSLWLRIDRRRSFEIATRHRFLSVRTERLHLKETWILEWLVHGQSEHRHYEPLLLYDERHGWSGLIGSVRHQQIHFIDIDQLGVDSRHEARIALIVVVDQFHGTTDQAARLIHFLCPDL